MASRKDKTKAPRCSRCGKLAKDCRCARYGPQHRAVQSTAPRERAVTK